MTDPIEHVIVLMLENRAFDHILGDCAKVRAHAGHGPDKFNQYNGTSYSQCARVCKILCARHSMRTWRSYATYQEEPGGRCRPACHSL